MPLTFAGESLTAAAIAVVEKSRENRRDGGVGPLKMPLDFPSLFPEVELIRDPDLRSGVEAVWQELWQASELESVHDLVASPEFPYPHIPHNRAVVQMALAVASTFERFHSVTVDRDLLVAAALLQDASKLVEFIRDGDTVTSSELGRQYPHAFWAAHVALKHGLPDDVCHIIIHHTPQA